MLSQEFVGAGSYNPNMNPVIFFADPMLWSGNDFFSLVELFVCSRFLSVLLPGTLRSGHRVSPGDLSP